MECFLDGCAEVSFGLAGGCLVEFLGEQCFEGFGEFTGDVVVVVDEQSLEECLVELAMDLSGALR